MSDDLVDRLRRWVHAVDAGWASDLMDEAADEIERLRSEAGSVTTFLQKVECLEAEIARLRLTDAEREAAEEASEFYIGTRTGVALRGLLERLK